MIVLDRKDVVGLLVFDQEASGFFLSMHGVSRNDRSLDVQVLQQGLDARDLVGLFTNLLLGNDDSFPMQDGAKQMGSRFVAVVSATQGLGIQLRALAFARLCRGLGCQPGALQPQPLGRYRQNALGMSINTHTLSIALTKPSI